MLHGDDQPDLDSKLHVFLHFARKLTLTPEAITTDDFALLQSVGLSRVAVIDGILIVAGFNLINRMADALRFETPCPSDFWFTAKLLRRFGYRGLAGPGSLFRDSAWIRTQNSTGTCRTACEFPVLIDSAIEWLEFLTSLGSRAYDIAQPAATTVANMVLYKPASVTEYDVADLLGHGCTDGDIFDLILSAAATAGLIRVRAGLGALCQSLEAGLLSR